MCDYVKIQKYMYIPIIPNIQIFKDNIHKFEYKLKSIQGKKADTKIVKGLCFYEPRQKIFSLPWRESCI